MKAFLSGCAFLLLSGISSSGFTAPIIYDVSIDTSNFSQQNVDFRLEVIRIGNNPNISTAISLFDFDYNANVLTPAVTAGDVNGSLPLGLGQAGSGAGIELSSSGLGSSYTQNLNLGTSFDFGVSFDGLGIGTPTPDEQFLFSVSFLGANGVDVLAALPTAPSLGFIKDGSGLIATNLNSAFITATEVNNNTVPTPGVISLFIAGLLLMRARFSANKTQSQLAA